jgi:type 1 glutamine amidotransferase
MNRYDYFCGGFMRDRIKTAVVVGYHSFEVPAFYDFFMDMRELRPYIQHLEQFTSSSREVRQSYNAVLFYTMRSDTPVNDGPWYEGRALDALSELGETGQGIIVLHHSLMAFPRWPRWADICGLSPETYKGYALNQDLAFTITDEEHPITRGLNDFSLQDEAYMMGPSENTRVLLTTGSPNSMSHIGWVKQFGNSRVFCYQSGHGPSAWNHPSFREIVRRGIRWVAGRGDEDEK